MKYYRFLVRRFCVALMPMITICLVALLLSATVISNATEKKQKPNSNFNGVQIGVITYSWRSMPGMAEDIVSYCKESGISSIELMSNVVEEYAGIPASAPKIQRGTKLLEKEKEARQAAIKKATEAQRQWRVSISMDKFKELRKLFNKAGISIHIVKFPAAGKWSDEEIDYAFKAAKVLGAKGISAEIGHENCKRLGKFAEKHELYAIFHNHAQPGAGL